MSYFTEETSEELVLSRLAPDVDPRFREVMQSAVRHLHAFVKEIEPTMAEWERAIHFLTATGKICDDKRQEWILASDTLGVSMLIDAINHRRPGGATENTVLGPFHVSGAPERENGASICLDGKGAPCIVRGRVTDEDGNPIAGARVDVWQTNDDGYYDVQQPGVQPDMNMRGVFTTGVDGRYAFTTVKPLPYSIPTDGPVGAMLVAMGRHAMRPAHIHYIVTAPGYETLVTHIFPGGDPYLDSDAVFGVKESLIVSFEGDETGHRAEFDVRLKTMA
jgi:catechol 1,2-dioxygenase